MISKSVQAFPRERQGVWTCVSLLALAVSLAGCSSQSSTETVEKTESSDSAVKSASDAGDPVPAKGKKKGTKKKSGAHIGEIPKDAWPEIWFDTPSAVAAETGAPKNMASSDAPSAAAAAGDQSTADPSATPDSSTAGAAKPAGAADASGDWAKLFPAEAFADETKAIRASLSAKMQSVGQFNGAYRDIQVDATVLAALAQIASEYSDGPSWRKNAPMVRDVSADMSREANSVGEKFFSPTKAAFEKLESLMSGSIPPGVAETPAKMAFNSFAPRFPLMKRLERAQSWLKANVNSAELLKKESDRVIREAGVLAALSQMIAVGGYDGADDELYQSLVAGVRDGAVNVAAAARDQDFAAYTAALDAVYKSCLKCHSEFKNN